MLEWTRDYARLIVYYVIPRQTFIVQIGGTSETVENDYEKVQFDRFFLENSVIIITLRYLFSAVENCS